MYKSMHDTIKKINKSVYGHITTLLIRGYQRDFQIDFQGSFWISEVVPQAFRETIEVNDWKQARRKASREEIESGEPSSTYIVPPSFAHSGREV